MFTTENTEGFDQATLDKMNSELNDTIADLDENDTFYDSNVKSISDKIFNKYC